MPEPISGEIKVKITEERLGGVGVERVGGGGRRTPEEQSLGILGQSNKVLQRFLPMLGAAGGILALVKSSQLIQQTLKTTFEILGAMVDVFLMPLIPLIVEISRGLASLVPIIMEISNDIIAPLVDIFLPVLQSILKVVKDLLDPLIAIIAILKNPLRVVFGIMESFGKFVLGGAGPGAFPKGYTEEERFAPPRIDWTDSWAKFVEGIGGFLDKYLGFLKYKEEPTRQLGGFIPKTGMYLLHRGEEVSTSRLNPVAITVNNQFEVNMSTTANIDDLINSISRNITSSIETAIRRGR